ncbi:MAG TPA: hypothetical protein PLG16_04675, partial [Planctomycetota bacterium]|nr:hypothetical protein [Planctomycetota bacterium]
SPEQHYLPRAKLPPQSKIENLEKYNYIFIAFCYDNYSPEQHYLPRAKLPPQSKIASSEQD